MREIIYEKRRRIDTKALSALSEHTKRKVYRVMTWDGNERRGETITVADVKNAVYEANEKFFEKVQKMCDDNLEKSLLKHTQEYTHFDKSTKTMIYDMLASFKRRIKIQYIIGVPLGLLCVERFLNRIGWF